MAKAVDPQAPASADTRIEVEGVPTPVPWWAILGVMVGIAAILGVIVTSEAVKPKR